MRTEIQMKLEWLRREEMGWEGKGKEDKRKSVKRADLEKKFESLIRN